MSALFAEALMADENHHMNTCEGLRSQSHPMPRDVDAAVDPPQDPEGGTVLESASEDLPLLFLPELEDSGHGLPPTCPSPAPPVHDSPLCGLCGLGGPAVWRAVTGVSDRSDGLGALGPDDESDWSLTADLPDVRRQMEVHGFGRPTATASASPAASMRPRPVKPSIGSPSPSKSPAHSSGGPVPVPHTAPPKAMRRDYCDTCDVLSCMGVAVLLEFLLLLLVGAAYYGLVLPAPRFPNLPTAGLRAASHAETFRRPRGLSMHFREDTDGSEGTDAIPVSFPDAALEHPRALQRLRRLRERAVHDPTYWRWRSAQHDVLAAAFLRNITVRQAAICTTTANPILIPNPAESADVPDFGLPPASVCTFQAAQGAPLLAFIPFDDPADPYSPQSYYHQSLNL